MISFQQQLSRLIVTIVSLVAGSIVLVFLGLSILSLRKSVAEKLFPQAETIAINLKGSLALNEIYRAQEILSTMKGDPTIEGAYLLNRDHKPLALYEKPAPIGTVRRSIVLFEKEKIVSLLEQRQRQAIFTWRHLTVFIPIFEEERLLGTLYIVGSLTPLYNQIGLLFLVTFSASFALVVFGIRFSRRLQLSMSLPIRRLADKMRSISSVNDYTAHTEPPVNQEVDALVSGFNTMISRIARHELTLEEINSSLEEKVAARTADLNQSLQEKDLLIREIHHRVKNNLQVIISLLSLQMKKVSDPEAIDALASSLGRTRSISLIHEKLYASRLSSETQAETYLSDLCREIFRFNNISEERIRLRLDIAPVTLDADRLVNLALLLHELLTNTFKHAFSEETQGVVEITLNELDGHLHLVVHDNGGGLPPDFVLQGTTSLGLRLATNLARQLGGTFSLWNTSPGTKALLVFPYINPSPPLSPLRQRGEP